jgi:hypothetical protein
MVFPVPFAVQQYEVTVRAGTEVHVKSVGETQIKVTHGVGEATVAKADTDYDERLRVSKQSMPVATPSVAAESDRAGVVRSAPAAGTFGVTGFPQMPRINGDMQRRSLRVGQLLQRALDDAAAARKRFVDSVLEVEGEVLAMQNSLSSNDPRLTLMVNATQALQSVVIALSQGQRITSPECDGLLVVASLRTSMLSAILNDQITPETAELLKTVLDAWQSGG